MFLRQTAIGREPLAIAMSGVRMGERVLQIGVDDDAVAGLLAAKPGLSGESTMLVADEPSAVKARRAIERTGALVNLLVQPPGPLPFDDNNFDLVIVHNRDRQLARLDDARRAHVFGECRRVLRSGGRVVVFEMGRQSGLAALFRRGHDSEVAGTTERDLEAAGFRAVRLLGDRDGYRFTEGINMKGRPA